MVESKRRRSKELARRPPPLPLLPPPRELACSDTAQSTALRCALPLCGSRESRPLSSRTQQLSSPRAVNLEHRPTLLDSHRPPPTCPFNPSSSSLSLKSSPSSAVLTPTSISRTRPAFGISAEPRSCAAPGESLRSGFFGRIFSLRVRSRFSVSSLERLRPAAKRQFWYCGERNDETATTTPSVAMQQEPSRRARTYRTFSCGRSRIWTQRFSSCLSSRVCCSRSRSQLSSSLNDTAAVKSLKIDKIKFRQSPVIQAELPSSLVELIIDFGHFVRRDAWPSQLLPCLLQPSITTLHVCLPTSTPSSVLDPLVSFAPNLIRLHISGAPNPFVQAPRPFLAACHSLRHLFACGFTGPIVELISSALES